jgi:hypothetical protein
LLTNSPSVIHCNLAAVGTAGFSVTVPWAAPPDAECVRRCAVVVHTRDARRIHIRRFMAIRVIIGFIFLLYPTVEGICGSGCNSTHSNGH